MKRPTRQAKAWARLNSPLALWILTSLVLPVLVVITSAVTEAVSQWHKDKVTIREINTEVRARNARLEAELRAFMAKRSANPLTFEKFAALPVYKDQTLASMAFRLSSVCKSAKESAMSVGTDLLTFGEIESSTSTPASQDFDKNVRKVMDRFIVVLDSCM